LSVIQGRVIYNGLANRFDQGDCYGHAGRDIWVWVVTAFNFHCMHQ
jgi:hypothetical protein